MNAKWLMPMFILLAACGGPPVDKQKPGPEICGNQADDDQNGLADCADAACAAEPACQTAAECTTQTECLGGQSYAFFTDRAMPQCVNETCVTPAASIDLHVTIKRPGYAGYPGAVGSINTRFIKKAAVDGSAVTCMQLNELATSNVPADANQIERTDLFNLLAYDVTSVNNGAGSSDIPLNSFSTSTGADFIIWMETWTGKLDSSTRLPTGKRLDWKCIESGPQVAEILPEHHWPSPSGTATSRTIVITLDGPKNP